MNGISGFCVGYLAGTLLHETGALWPLAVWAVWAIALVVADHTGDWWAS